MTRNQNNVGILNEGFQGSGDVTINDGYPFKRGHQGNPITNDTKVPPPSPKRQPKDGDK